MNVAHLLDPELLEGLDAMRSLEPTLGSLRTTRGPHGPSVEPSRGVQRFEARVPGEPPVPIESTRRARRVNGVFDALLSPNTERKILVTPNE